MKKNADYDVYELPTFSNNGVVDNVENYYKALNPMYDGSEYTTGEVPADGFSIPVRFTVSGENESEKHSIVIRNGEKETLIKIKVHGGHVGIKRKRFYWSTPYHGG